MTQLEAVIKRHKLNKIVFCLFSEILHFDDSKNMPFKIC